MTTPAEQTTQPDPAATSDCGRRIYLMTGLPPEVVAVAFAKTSRSPEPFDQIATELTESKSAEFHEKWVVGYGHASVAEHAVLSMAIENVSIIAAKAIEDNRLASYTEKSTRYQVYDPKRVYRPESILTNPASAARYETLITNLLETYIQWSNVALEWLKERNPKPEDKSERMWESRLRARVCDSIRYLLPTATLTNLGWTVNARALAMAIRKLGASQLPELRSIANELNAAAVAKVPTLLKYCDPDVARTEAEQTIAESLQSQLAPSERSLTATPPTVRILRHDHDILLRLTCAVAYPNQSADWDSLEATIRTWSTDDMLGLLRHSMAAVGPFDPLARAFEHVNYLAEITVDYGAWRDIQRHRIASQTAQELTPDLGFTVPGLINDMKLRPQFERLLEASAATYDALRPDFPHEAVYALMLAFRKRTLFGWNLREVFHFVRLRGTARGHAAYRVVAEELWRQVLKLDPWLGELMQPLGSGFRA